MSALYFPTSLSHSVASKISGATSRFPQHAHVSYDFLFGAYDFLLPRRGVGVSVSVEGHVWRDAWHFRRIHLLPGSGPDSWGDIAYAAIFQLREWRFGQFYSCNTGFRYFRRRNTFSSTPGSSSVLPRLDNSGHNRKWMGRDEPVAEYPAHTTKSAQKNYPRSAPALGAFVREY